MERRPIVIVGSGPAGASAALHLQRRAPALAADALILERAGHPRTKVCAGGLIPAVVRCLHELGLDLRVPHVVVHGARVTTPTTTVEHGERELCYIIRRNEFDASLVDACRARGITVRENEPVTNVQRDAAGVVVQTSKAVYHAQLVIGADGAGSVVRRHLVDSAKTRIARAVMCDVPVRDISWDGFAAQRFDFDFRETAHALQGYRWMFPCLIGGLPHVNVGAYSVTPRGKALNQVLAEYVGTITSEKPRHAAFPIHWYRSGVRVGAPHVLLAGDAAGVDPLMGEGISLALEYGGFVAAAASEMFRSGDFSATSYQHAVENSWLGKKLRRLHLATRLFYGPTWRIWFGIAEHSQRARTLGLRWYNGIDGWDRRSGWAALASLLTRPISEKVGG